MSKILIVEDDPNFGSILKDYLKLHSYDVSLAKNGIEGLEKFKKTSYDLCILDVMMPFKDGFSLATDIRSLNEEILFGFTFIVSSKILQISFTTDKFVFSFLPPILYESPTFPFNKTLYKAEI